MNNYQFLLSEREEVRRLVRAKRKVIKEKKQKKIKKEKASQPQSCIVIYIGHSDKWLAGRLKNYFMEYTFDDIWRLLNPQGEFVRRVNACGKIWSGLALHRRKHIYDTIVTLKAQGKYVNPNPLFAIKDNDDAEPEFLKGDEGGDLVQVRYNGAYKICTRETMNEFNLEFVRDW